MKKENQENVFHFFYFQFIDFQKSTREKFIKQSVTLRKSFKIINYLFTKITLRSLLQWEKLENAFHSKKLAYPSSLLETKDGSGDSDYQPFENMDWESEYEARKIRLRQLCETEEFKPEFSVQDSWRNGSSPDVRFVVDENNKVLYCELPKVGCTNWKRTMLQLIQPKTFGKLAFDDIKGPHGHYGEEGYKYITEWPAEERLKMVDTFYKFIFVRHPLERILSAYRLFSISQAFLKNIF